jgi:hypothetical protein
MTNAEAHLPKWVKKKKVGRTTRKLCALIDHRLCIPEDFSFLRYGRWGVFRCLCGQTGGWPFWEKTSNEVLQRHLKEET